MRHDERDADSQSTDASIQEEWSRRVNRVQLVICGGTGTFLLAFVVGFLVVLLLEVSLWAVGCGAVTVAALYVMTSALFWRLRCPACNKAMGVEALSFRHCPMCGARLKGDAEPRDRRPDRADKI